MTDFDRAIKDIGAVINSNKYELEKKNVSGAVPMPLRSVKEANEALLFKQKLMAIVKGFEINQPRAISRANDCQSRLEPYAVGYDMDILYNAFDALRATLNEFFS